MKDLIMIIIALLLNIVAFGQTKDDTYKQYDFTKIDAMYQNFSNEGIVVSNTDGIQLKKGNVILFVTTDGHLGKLEIVSVNKDKSNNTTFNFIVYNDDGTVKISKNNFLLKSTYVIDFDKGSDKPINSDGDIWLQREGETTYLTPENELSMYLVP